MKLQIHPILIVRTPKFSYTAELSASWDMLKLSIKISSEAFYQNIKDVEAEDLDKLPQKIQFTIWKYFNRAKYRATPYGSFASFSLLKQHQNEPTSSIIITEEQNLHEFIDWPVKNEIHFNFEELLKLNSKLFSNSSYYVSADSIRYIASTDGQFELAEIEYDEFVFKILKHCSEPIPIITLIEQLQLDTTELESFYDLLIDMLGIQLLLSEQDPNILGEDYFDRIHYQAKTDTEKYIIAERKPISGNLDYNLLSNLPNLIQKLQYIAPLREPKALKHFVNRFIAKFEQREVSLVLALDPEMGVGYDDLEQAGQDDDFITQFLKHQNDQSVNEGYNQFKSSLKEKFPIINFDNKEVLYLDKMIVPNLDRKMVLPNSFSVVMGLVDGLICLEQLGGVTANALSGRFTIANNEVFEYAKSITKIEEMANPDVLFFDVAYMIEANVDNINRRKLIYNYQLSLLNFDTSENPLTLDDIMVSVHAGQVVLRSKRFNKRIIPKIASAYNYSRSDLSVFRLLCDLQHQSVLTNLTISLENLFPDQNYYPRFQYKNIILSQAKWRINSNDLFTYLEKDNSHNNCKKYLLQLGVSEYFKMGSADQTLTFNVDNQSDLIAFIAYMNKQKTAYLEEVLMSTTSMVNDEFGKSYLAQYILSITHQEEVYKGYSKFTQNTELPQKQFYLPGGEWLYFEIFCHQQRSDYLLLTIINDFVNQFKTEIKSWFFIRYNENGDHIRFRVLLNDEKDNQKLTASFSNNLAPLLSSGLVSDFVIKTYKRELERYGNELIEDVEKHFCIDSCFVLSIISAFSSANTKYKFCSLLAYSIQNADVFDLTSFKSIIQDMSDSYNKEHQLNVNDYKRLNAQYLLYKVEELPVLDQEQQNLFNAFSKSFIEILKNCRGEKRRKLFGDLLHMHVNRLFSKDQRTHEMVMYYYLLKDVLRKLAIEKKG